MDDKDFRNKYFAEPSKEFIEALWRPKEINAEKAKDISNLNDEFSGIWNVAFK